MLNAKSEKLLRSNLASSTAPGQPSFLQILCSATDFLVFQQKISVFIRLQYDFCLESRGQPPHLCKLPSEIQQKIEPSMYLCLRITPTYMVKTFLNQSKLIARFQTGWSCLLCMWQCHVQTWTVLPSPWCHSKLNTSPPQEGNTSSDIGSWTKFSSIFPVSLWHLVWKN